MARDADDGPEELLRPARLLTRQNMPTAARRQAVERSSTAATDPVQGYDARARPWLVRRVARQRARSGGACSGCVTRGRCAVAQALGRDEQAPEGGAVPLGRSRAPSGRCGNFMPREPLASPPTTETVLRRRCAGRRSSVRRTRTCRRSSGTTRSRAARRPRAAVIRSGRLGNRRAVGGLRRLDHLVRRQAARAARSAARAARSAARAACSAALAWAVAVAGAGRSSRPLDCVSSDALGTIDAVALSMPPQLTPARTNAPKKLTVVFVKPDSLMTPCLSPFRVWFFTVATRR